MNSVSTFDVVIHGVSWAYSKFGSQSPTEAPIIKQIIQAAHRQIGKATINRKLPLAKFPIQQLHDKIAQACLDQLQILTFMMLGFVAFLHWDDLSRLRNQVSGIFFLKKERMISVRRGLFMEEFVAALSYKYCLILLPKKLLSRGLHFRNSYLFGKICHTSSGFRLTYSRALKLVRKQLKAIHLNPGQYGLVHSMKSRGTGLAASLGVPDRLIMQ